MRRTLLLLSVVLLAGCGGDDPGTPTNPNPSPNPAPTPTPSPTPTPNPYAAACGTPLPPFEHSYGIGIKVFNEPSINRKVLDSNPLIRNAEYCHSVGIPATICATRREDSPQRTACDHYLSGISFTGRPGPNWFQDVNGRLLRCGGVAGVPSEAPDCRLHEGNQYFLHVTAPGQYVACGGQGAPQTCGGCYLEPNSFDRIHTPTPAGLCKVT